MAFRVGQKVVCIEDEAHHRYAKWRCAGGMNGLRKDTIYTVRGVGNYKDVQCVWLEEILRPITTGWEQHGECGFAVQRFRPLIEKSTETGMAILRKLLEPEKAKEKI